MKQSRSEVPLTIGALSRFSGVHTETIRYYEKIGLLPNPQRSPGGYRQYDPIHLATLTFIRRGRQLGFPLDTIRDLLRLNDTGACCEQVREVTVAHRSDVRRKIADLRRLDRALDDLIDACKPDRLSYCPILEALSKPSPP